MIKQSTIQLLKTGDRKAQKEVYDHLSPSMYGVCRRYIHNAQDAEDTMINAFFKAFTQIDQLKEQVSLQAWIRRIMVNESLNHLRKYKKHIVLELKEEVSSWESDFTADRQLAAADIMKLLDELPTGYRTVFNLYVIEGYSHKEIAEKLAISVNTSKSQLIKARRKLQQLMADEDYRVV